MNKIKRILKINVLAVLLIGFLTVGVYSADSKPVADEMIGSSGISWTPKVNYSQLELTISRPNGTVFSKTFNSGSSLYASLSEIFGDSYLDGSYKYELRVTPILGQQSRSTEVDRFSAQTRETLLQSGAFFVRGGAIVTDNIYEPGSEAASGLISGAQDGLSGAKDIVHADDVIIQFSACIGNDCVNNENFGFDTLRLKENNLRIHFDDTSNSASFPNNDWRITINDTSNGGASYFRVDDATNGKSPFTIEANTPSHTLYVDSAGRIGIGTSTPVVDLHVKQGNTPTLRLEQDGSSGFTPQTWDVAGNEANFFVRDATNGSKLPFRIRPNAPENSIYIATNGVGFGTNSPGFPIHLKTNSSTNAAIVIERASGVQNFINATASFGNFGTVNEFPAQIMTNSIWRMRINTDGTLNMSDGGSYDGNWNSASSRELKDNIKSISADEAIDALDGLNPVKYNYKNDKAEEHVGFIAEDVPELVSMKDRKNLSTMDIVAVLTKVVQEQQKSIREQHMTIAELKKEIAELKKK
jgi:hypothetical protein